MMWKHLISQTFWGWEMSWKWVGKFVESLWKVWWKFGETILKWINNSFPGCKNIVSINFPQAFPKSSIKFQTHFPSLKCLWNKMFPHHFSLISPMRKCWTQTCAHRRRITYCDWFFDHSVTTWIPFDTPYGWRESKCHSEGKVGGVWGCRSPLGGGMAQALEFPCIGLLVHITWESAS